MPFNILERPTLITSSVYPWRGSRIMLYGYHRVLLHDIQARKQTNKQENKHTSKKTNKQTSKKTHIQARKQTYTQAGQPNKLTNTRQTAAR